MAEEGEQQSSAAASGGSSKDIRFSYIQERLASSLKLKEEAWQKFMASEGK